MPPHPEPTRRWPGATAIMGLLLLAMGGADPMSLNSAANPASTAPPFTPVTCTTAAGHLQGFSAGSPTQLAVLFLHGTPGRWRAFERYLSDPELAARLHLVAIDRPGWGDSTQAGEPHTSAVTFAQHSKALTPLLMALAQENGGAGTIILGHSLGASLAPRLAADQPSLVRGLLLLSGSHNPELRARRWYNLLAETLPVRWLLSNELRRANDEIMALPEELRRNSKLWPRLDLPVTVIQGLQDPLVAPGHVNFVAALNPGARILRLEDANHFIPWNRYPLIKAELLALADRVTPSLARPQDDSQSTRPGQFSSPATMSAARSAFHFSCTSVL